MPANFHSGKVANTSARPSPVPCTAGKLSRVHRRNRGSHGRFTRISDRKVAPFRLGLSAKGRGRQDESLGTSISWRTLSKFNEKSPNGPGESHVRQYDDDNTRRSRSRKPPRANQAGGSIPLASGSSGRGCKGSQEHEKPAKSAEKARRTGNTVRHHGTKRRPAPGGGRAAGPHQYKGGTRGTPPQRGARDTPTQRGVMVVRVVVVSGARAPPLQRGTPRLGHEKGKFSTQVSRREVPKALLSMIFHGGGDGSIANAPIPLLHAQIQARSPFSVDLGEFSPVFPKTPLGVTSYTLSQPRQGWEALPTGRGAPPKCVLGSEKVCVRATRRTYTQNKGA